MRIVAGKFKSRNIIAPEGDNTRPTSDKTRQAIFNIIASYVYDSKVLDIFSGSGALGLEALSRGASSVLFIDKDIKAINIIKQNISSLKVNEQTKVINDDYSFIKTLNDKFDIIMLDPPYKMDVINEIVDIVMSNNLLNENGIIVYESNADHCLKNDIDGFNIKQYKYGIAIVNILYKK